MGELFVSRSADRDDPGNPGVYARRQPPDSAPLARRIPAFKKNRAGNALLVGFIRQIVHFRLQLGQFLLVYPAFARPGKIDGIQSGNLPYLFFTRFRWNH